MPGKLKKTRGVEAEDFRYFFLMTHIGQGARQSAAEKERGISAVTKAVLSEGGKCKLYLTKGAAYDYVSVMTGISAAAAIRIGAVIESRGTVKVTTLPGILQVNVE